MVNESPKSEVKVVNKATAATGLEVGWGPRETVPVPSLKSGVRRPVTQVDISGVPTKIFHTSLKIHHPLPAPVPPHPQRDFTSRVTSETRRWAVNRAESLRKENRWVNIRVPRDVSPTDAAAVVAAAADCGACQRLADPVLGTPYPEPGMDSPPFALQDWGPQVQ